MQITLPKIVTADAPAPATEVRPHLSHSQISMYQRCSKQYWYRYVLGLKQRPSVPLTIGKGGHTALEKNGRHKIATGVDLPVADLLDAASDAINAEAIDLDSRDKVEIGPAKDKALDALRVFRTKTAPSIKPAGVEIEFNLDLNEPDKEPLRIINGRIDLITEDLVVPDYKFVSKAKNQLEADVSLQLTIYNKVVHAITGQYATGTGFHQFVTGLVKPDARYIGRRPELMTPEAQERRFVRMADQIRVVQRKIDAGFFEAIDDPKACSWCGYRDRCQSSLVDDYEAASIRAQG